MFLLELLKMHDVVEACVINVLFLIVDGATQFNIITVAWDAQQGFVV